jgi:hypothetical protein
MVRLLKVRVKTMSNHKNLLQTSLLCLALALTATTSHAAKNDDDEDKTEYLPYNEKMVKEWSLIKDDQRHQIKTYSKQEDNRRYRSFKVQGILNGSLEAAARCQFDIENLTAWYMNAIESKLLKRVSDTEYYFYFRLKMPLGVPQRDVVVHAKVQPYSAKTGFLGITYSAEPDFIPAKPGVIRMPAYETSTKLTPLGADKVEEQLEGYADPGGAGMPTWLINYAQRRAPYANMLGRQRVITKCAASDSPIPFKYKE